MRTSNRHLKALLLPALFIFGFENLSAQTMQKKEIKTPSETSTTEIRELSIGDKVPDIEISNLINSSSQSFKFSDYKDKLIIIDFWATWCGPCVAALPKMQLLQNEFKNKVIIIPVTQEAKDRVLHFFQRNKIAKETISLVTIYEDNILYKYFKHKEVPHEVWIKDREVKAITTDQYVTAENINLVLTNKKVNWIVKGESGDFDATKPILLPPNTSSSTIIYSGFTGYINGASPGLYRQKDTANKTLRYNQFNSSLLTLYSLSLGKFPLFTNPKRCIIKKNSSAFIYNIHSEYRNEWNRKNLYNYEAIVPLYFTETEIRKKLKDDLDFFFKIESRIELRKIPVLVLRVNNPKIIQTTEELPTYKLYIKDNKQYCYQQKNSLISDFINTLNYDPWLIKMPLVIDETNLDIMLNLQLEIGSDPENIEKWNEELNKYGLILTPEERETELLILNN